MSKIAYFNLPDVGEGLTEAEIVSWKVKPGDTVSVNQVIVEIETAKSLVELPCPFAGVISELMAAEGDTVEVGKPLISATVADDAVGATVAQAETAAAVHQAVADVASTAAAAEERTPNLVGYGVADPNGPVRRKRAATSLGTNTSSISVVPGHLAVPTHPETQVLAKPPIRKLAADLGVDLSKVTPTGLNGDITREDVMGMAQQASVFRNLSTPAAPTAREERIPVKGVRKAIANAMVSSAFTAPHVSIFVDVDATRTMEYVKRLKVSTDFAGTKVTPLLIMAKAMMWAVRRNPMVNATFTAEEIIVHNFVNF